MSHTERPYTVYVLTNTANGRRYVGQSNDVPRRIKQHMEQPSSRIYGDIMRYGRAAFTVELLTSHPTLVEARAAEAEVMRRLGSTTPETGYNRPPSGGAGEGNANAKRRAVKQLTLEGALVAIFPSIKNASEITGIHRTHIQRTVTRKSTHTAGGYRWVRAAN